MIDNAQASTVAPRKTFRRRIFWAIAGLLVIGFGAIWHFGLLGLALHTSAMLGASDERKDKNLWLPYYAATIDALQLEGLSDNVSGLTFNAETGTLFTVVNRPPEIVELSPAGAVLRRIELRGAADTEGIAHVAGNRFIVVDEKRSRFIWIDIDPDVSVINLEAAPFFTLDIDAFSNMGFEGISWDQRNSSLLVTKEMWPIKVLVISGLERALEGKGLGITVKEWHPDLFAGHASGDLSSVTIHDPTGNIVLLSDLTSVLTEYSPEGEAVSLLPLWGGWNGLRKGIPQAEGVAIGPDGAIYIVSEPNLFYRFERKERTSWAKAP
jgi:uncharacterized protein YjiK